VFGLPSQSVHPVSHAIPHCELVHVAVMCAAVGHTLLHPPHFKGSDDVTASHPLVFVLSQFENPGSHTCIWQLPNMQVAVA